MNEAQSEEWMNHVNHMRWRFFLVLLLVNLLGTYGLEMGRHEPLAWVGYVLTWVVVCSKSFSLLSWIVKPPKEKK